MPHCTEGRIGFGRLGRRVIEADFDGGELSSDGGLMLLRRVDERIGLSRAAARRRALHGVLVDQFVAAHGSAPEELVLDIDASDVPLHGTQECSEFHAYYDHHCYLPLYAFCGQAMLACYLPSTLRR